MWTNLEGPDDTLRSRTLPGASWEQAGHAAIAGLIICVLILGALAAAGSPATF